MYIERMEENAILDKKKKTLSLMTSISFLRWVGARQSRAGARCLSTRVNSERELIIPDRTRTYDFIAWGAVLYASGMNNCISMSVLGLREWAETGNRTERGEKRGRAETATVIEGQIQNPISTNRANSASTVDPNTTRPCLIWQVDTDWSYASSTYLRQIMPSILRARTRGYDLRRRMLTKSLSNIY